MQIIRQSVTSSNSCQRTQSHFESQTISAEQLKAAEDAALDLIAMQQEVGLKVATDGELGGLWHYDYMGALDGLDLEECDAGGTLMRVLGYVLSGDFGQAGFSGKPSDAVHYRYLVDNCAIIPYLSIAQLLSFQNCQLDIQPSSG